MFSGSPCQDASALHPESGTVERRTCVANGTHLTGSLFREICKVAALPQVKAVLLMHILDNVFGLASPPRHRGRIVGPSNLSIVV